MAIQLPPIFVTLSQLELVSVYYNFVIITLTLKLWLMVKSYSKSDNYNIWLSLAHY